MEETFCNREGTLVIYILWFIDYAQLNTGFPYTSIYHDTLNSLLTRFWKALSQFDSWTNLLIRIIILPITQNCRGLTRSENWNMRL